MQLRKYASLIALADGLFKRQAFIQRQNGFRIFIRKFCKVARFGQSLSFSTFPTLLCAETARIPTFIDLNCFLNICSFITFLPFKAINLSSISSHRCLHQHQSGQSTLPIFFNCLPVFFGIEYFQLSDSPTLIIEFSKMNAEIKSKNFVGKLEYLLQNPSYQRIISWSDKNTVIEVLDSHQMQKEILPFYFRHQKFESFVRQLNLYGFKKLKSPEKQRFTHPLLQSGNRLSQITSCKASKSKIAESNEKGEALSSRHLNEKTGYGHAGAQKLAGSAFTIYNPLTQNRSNIFIPGNMERGVVSQAWKEKVAEGSFVVIPGHQYLMWNWMEYFNCSCVGNILLNKKDHSQSQQITH